MPRSASVDAPKERVDGTETKNCMQSQEMHREVEPKGMRTRRWWEAFTGMNTEKNATGLSQI